MGVCLALDLLDGLLSWVVLLSRPWLALVGFGRLWSALVGFGRLRSAFDDSCFYVNVVLMIIFSFIDASSD